MEYANAFTLYKLRDILSRFLIYLIFSFDYLSRLILRYVVHHRRLGKLHKTLYLSMGKICSNLIVGSGVDSKVKIAITTI